MDQGPLSPLRAKERSTAAVRERQEGGVSEGARTRGRARSASRTCAHRRRRGRLLIALALAVGICAAVPLATDAAKPQDGPSPTALVEQWHKLTGTGETDGGQLGSSMALSGDGSTLIVGAPKDGHGAAYVFVREGEGSGTKWVQQGGKLTPPEGGGEECTSGCGSEECFEEASAGEGTGECSFGTSVAVSANGDVVLVGDPSAGAGPGAAWVFTREDSTWTRSAVLRGPGAPAEGRFGRSVALSADGATALVGDPSAANQRGEAWVFTHEGSSWNREEERMTDGEDSELAHAGRSVALSADGQTALLGGPGDDDYTGAAWAFRRESGRWQQVPGKSKLVGEGASPGEHAGKAVALSGDGNTALLGAQNAEGNHGLVWAFALEGEHGFVEQGGPIHAFTPGEAESEGRFGESLALSEDGDTALIGAPQSEHGVGSVSVLEREGAAWTRRERLAGVGASAKSWSGGSVALSADGMTAALGAPRDTKQSGAAWVFHEAETVTAPLEVTNVAPSRGPTTGGTSVRISGGGFYSVEAVEFGKTQAPSFEVLSPTEIAVVTPPSPPGHVDVTVKTANGTSETSADDRFTFEEAGEGEEGPSHEPENEEEPKSKSKEEPHASTTTTTATTSGQQGASGGVQAFVASAGACRVSLAKKRLAVTRYRTVALRLARTGTGPCSGSLALSYRIKAKGRGYTLRTIGTASFSLARGASEVVSIKLTRAGQKWLRLHKGKGNASLAIARVVPAPTLAQSSSVRLSVKKTRKRATRR